MLDKSVPYKHIIMKIFAEDIAAVDEPALPRGFTFQFFKDGNEHDWARIETSVLEFDSTQDALNYFVRDYIPYQEALQTRCVFVADPDGLLIATAMAWFADSELGYQPTLHWVSVCPQYQGLGIGKAIVQKVMRIFLETDPKLDVFLHTQTWSHKAIKIYHDIGYRLLKNEKLAVMSNDSIGVKIAPNEYDEAIPILKNIIDSESFQSIVANAI